MLDFASASYLGFLHQSRELRSWKAFTTGVPAALAEPRLARQVARGFAELQGCERATLAASTLHLFWDLFGVLGARDIAVLLDGGTYPIARWGAERATRQGAPVRVFRHHDLGSLAGMLEQLCRRGRRPVVVTDGFCPNCGKTAPIAGFLAQARRFGGWLVIDDTQALGVLGRSPKPLAPFGSEGGGMLQHAGVFGADVILVCSTAKAFGVPLGVLSASRDVVSRFEAKSDTRVHCSPPSVATLRAAEHALSMNRAHGEAIRAHLARLVGRFRSRAAEARLAVEGGLFPVQSLAALSSRVVPAIHRRLLRSGVRSVLTRSRHDSSPRLSFLFTARHTALEIDRALELLGCAVRATHQPGPACGVDHGMRMRKLS